MKLLFTLLIAGSGVLCAQNNLNLVAANNLVGGETAKAPEITYRTQSAVSYRKVKNILLVEGKVNGDAGTFILDTGAPGLVLNEKLTPETRKIAGTGIFKKVQVGLKKILHFSFGEIERKNIETHTVDITHLTHALKTPISGLMGYDIFHGKGLFINQMENYIEVFKKRKQVFDLIGKPTFKIPFNLLGHLPVIKAKIGRQNIFCGIDTGSSIHLLDKEIAKTYCLPPREGGFEYIKGLGSDNIIRKEIKMIPRLEAGNAVMWETNCVPADLGHLQDVIDEWEIEALLGMPFFANYKFVLIDYRSLNIYLWQ